eukprot:CAMPEP_0176338768 /NCGR_PEP_ID=MMETSP0126-20121128/218_1 /TAXON_ID=141414 ORGANISM="Strombidinopsis acuminatum, Strain SPMC142" /NCGR_SAMPLE_ID=MMETSP0126 /ASSEMBLY_ACC=CAM_ASM_000229 /LENGTH=62 /DNA_ID=CAMNT_0017681935 /DNA_START=47 /DNA_END=235 /DNA_ORIENTATION=-
MTDFQEEVYLIERKEITDDEEEDIQYEEIPEDEDLDDDLNEESDQDDDLNDFNALKSKTEKK